jgi:MFS family permease
LILVLVPSFPTLLIGRILQGACVGIDGSVIPIVIKEYTPISLNGLMGAVHNSVVGLGYLLGFLLAFLLSQFFKP